MGSTFHQPLKYQKRRNLKPLMTINK